MPAPGEQHLHGAIKNPFDEPVSRISEFTAIEIATLQSRLDRQLGPEYISTRAGPGGGRVHYLAAEKVINLANEVFGFNGWSSSIQRSEIDFVDVSENTNKVTLGMSVIVRVTLRDGTFHEDMGYGHIENCKGKAPAFEKARKEAVTDALKRALRNFGKVLGNCLYDKDYLSKVTKIKIAPSKFDETSLHRHPDYAPVKREPVAEVSHPETPARANNNHPESQPSEVEDDFGAGGLFDGVELAPDRGSSSGDQPGFRDSTGSNGRPPGPQRHVSMPAAAQTPQTGSTGAMPPPVGPLPNGRPQASSNHPQHLQQRPQLRASNTSPNQVNAVDPASIVEANSITTPTFFSSRAVARNKEETLSDKAIANLPKFNPAAESPSIKRTPGIDHTKSAAIGRAIVGQPPKPESNKDQLPSRPEPQQTNGQPPAAPPANAQSMTPQVPPQRAPPQPNFVNPAADPGRRIGMPGAANRPLYRPPSGVKRPLPPDSRPPLADVSNATAGAGSPGKRTRLSG
ncbi:MAG: hypothetical protein Q9159_005047 [Coniocarpon cinnabarinum]